MFERRTSLALDEFAEQVRRSVSARGWGSEGCSGTVGLTLS